MAGVEVPAGYSTIVCDLVTEPAVAVSVVFCVLLTADATRLKLADDSPAETFTDFGAVSALLLVESMTSV